MTGPASRPARALRGSGVLFVILIAARVPTVQREFRDALASTQRSVAIATRTRRQPLEFVAVRRLPPDAYTTSRISLPRRVVPRLAKTNASSLVPARATPTPPPVPLPVPAPSGGIAPAWQERKAIPVPQRRLPPPTAGDLATAAYARLTAGDRRSALRLFDAALALGDGRAPTWRRQRDALIEHWSGSVYSIVRGSGPVGLTSTPVLGGGQSGGGIAFTPDPLASRPVAITLRGSIAHDDHGRSSFAAVGVQWHPVSNVTLAAERLIAVGPAARGEWTMRAAAGLDRTIGRVRADGYGEAGVIGNAIYAAAQARVGVGVVVHDRQLEVVPGAGVWTSLQHDHRSIDRVDIGPGVVAHAGAVAVALDYRFRLAGNAAPGSGPVLTLSAAF